jgi:ADP-ribose pyrophosphatase
MPADGHSRPAELLLETQKFRVERIHFTDAAGRPQSKEVVRHPGAVAILPILDDGRLCLIRNVRRAVGETLIEVPAGTLDPSETPQACAFRELTEETGYVAEQLQPLGWFYKSPGILDERMHLFLATKLTLKSQNLMPDEQIENLIVSLDDALVMIDAGDIHEAKTIVAVLRYARLRVGGDSVGD